MGKVREVIRSITRAEFLKRRDKSPIAKKGIKLDKVGKSWKRSW